MNVVFIVLDSLRADRLSVYNDDIDFTDSFGSLAEDATVFTDAVAQASWTLPSHASMFTGEYPWEHGATQANLALETDTETLAERFSEQGYATACYTANAWVTPQIGMTDGFDDVDNFFPFLPMDRLRSVVKKFWSLLGTGGSRARFIKYMERFGEWFHIFAQKRGSNTPEVVEKSIDFMERNDDFFLFVNLMDPHLPRYPPEPYKSRHAPDVDLDDMIQVDYKHNGGFEEMDFDAQSRVYDAEVDYVDDKIEEIMAYLEEAGRLDDTVVVVTADHGELLGEYGLAGHSFSVDEELISVPLLIYRPDEEGGRVTRQVELRELYDIVPAAAGLQEMPEIGTEYASGGIAYPTMHLSNIPEDRREQLGYRRTFVRTGETRVEKLERDDEVRYRCIDIDSGTVEHDGGPDGVPPDLLERVDRIDREDGTGASLDADDQALDADDQVKSRLEDLGYI